MFPLLDIVTLAMGDLDPEEIPPELWLPLADWAENLARELREKAARRSAVKESYLGFRDRDDELGRAMARIEGYCAIGIRPADAICKIADETGLEIYTLHNRWQALERSRRHTRKGMTARTWHRSLRAWQLRLEGLDNREIGRILQIHPKSVSRILRRFKGDGGSESAPPGAQRRTPGRPDPRSAVQPRPSSEELSAPHDEGEDNRDCPRRLEGQRRLNIVGK